MKSVSLYLLPTCKLAFYIAAEKEITSSKLAEYWRMLSKRGNKHLKVFKKLQLPFAVINQNGKNKPKQ